MMLVTCTPRAARPWARGWTTAVPTPPPTQHGVAGVDELGGAAQWAGDVLDGVARPRRTQRSQLVLPTAWMTSVMVPRLGSASAMVSGMRSAPSPRRTMTNWPGCRTWAMRLASMTSRVTLGERTSLLDDWMHRSPSAYLSTSPWTIGALAPQWTGGRANVH